MKREVEYTQTKTLKAKITASKPHFVQKVIATRLTTQDAFKHRFCNDITIFIPKLRPDFTRPCVMMHVKNGNGSTLIRCRTPIELAELLRELADKITSDSWLDIWEELNSIANNIYENKLNLDDTFIDVGEFEKEINENQEQNNKIVIEREEV